MAASWQSARKSAGATLHIMYSAAILIAYTAATLTHQLPHYLTKQPSMRVTQAKSRTAQTPAMVNLHASPSMHCREVKPAKRT